MAEQQIDFAAVNLEDLHEKYDNVDPHIEQYFSAEEVKKMSDYEKQRYRNMKRNYLALNAIGEWFSQVFISGFPQGLVNMLILF